MKRVHGRTVGNRQAGKRGDRSFREHQPDSILNRLSGVPSISNWRDNKFCAGPPPLSPVSSPEFPARLNLSALLHPFPNRPLPSAWDDGGEKGWIRRRSSSASRPPVQRKRKSRAASGADLMAADGTFYDRIDEHFPTGSLRFVRAVLSFLFSSSFSSL